MGFRAVTSEKFKKIWFKKEGRGGNFNHNWA
jgi:hypothetical protein